MICTHKIALNPSPMQLRLLERHAAYARDAYNWALASFNDTPDAGRPYPVGMLFPMWEGARASLHPLSDELCQSAAKYAVMALAKADRGLAGQRQPQPIPRVPEPGRQGRLSRRQGRRHGAVRRQAHRTAQHRQRPHA